MGVPLTTSKGLAITLLSVLSIGLLVAAVGAFLSPELSIERTLTVNASEETVGRWIIDASQWPRWAGWRTVEAGAATRDATPHSYRWRFPDGQEGEARRDPGQTTSDAARFVVSIDGETRSTSKLTWKAQEPDSTEVRWLEIGSAGKKPLGGFLRILMEPRLEAHMDQGLAKLKALAESSSSQRAPEVRRGP